MNIPEEVSGRPVTGRGAHIVPFGYHGDWCQYEETRNYWLDLMVSMGLSWVVLLTEGDSCVEMFDGKPVVKWLLDHGIIPIIRDKQLLPRQFVNQDTVHVTSLIYADYGLKPFWIPYNEPRDTREWVNGIVPPDWWEQFLSCWKQAAHLVNVYGGYVGFPDGPCYDFDDHHPFRDTLDVRSLWDNGIAFYAGHYYNKGRPLNYPYDDVNRYGTPLTMEQWEEELGRWWGDPEWMTPTLAEMNAQRLAWRNPDATIFTDDTCWGGWEKIAHHSVETLGFSVPQAMTEGGRTPRDRPGGYPNIDIRYTLSTPEQVAIDTLDMFEHPDAPMFAQCPWILAGADMGGPSTWETDAWVGYPWADIYGTREKPVVQMLQDNPPQSGDVKEQIEDNVQHMVALLSESLGLMDDLPTNIG